MRDEAALPLRGIRCAEIFSGTGSLAKQFRRLGADTEEWDILPGMGHDLTKRRVQNNVLDKIRQGHYHFLCFGVCCTTFSRARRPGGGPPPLRSNHHLWGFPDLSLEKVQISNKLLLFTVKACRLASRLGVPWAIENPLISMLWKFQQIQSLRKQSQAAWVKVDYCQYGTPWRKRVGLLGTWPDLESV